MYRRAAMTLVLVSLFCACPALAADAPGKPAPSAKIAKPQADKIAKPQAAPAPSKQAQELRQIGDLIPFAPPPEVLNAYFTADENSPRAVYGPVSAYAKSRACKASWLIEKGEQARVERLKGLKDVPPFEFSLTLEEDCPGKVSHAVFVTAPGSTPEAWFNWRRQFNGGKAVGYYGAAQDSLKKAGQAGPAPTAELRFLSVNGELVCRNLEEVLKAEGRLAPVFDLVTGERPGQHAGK